MSVFVTVGTTCFDALVEVLSTKSVQEVLQSCGYERLVIQYGKGIFQPQNNVTKRFKTESYRYKDSIADDIANASLVISHAGAGSCLEVLAARKKLIVVINENLMNNHQYELAKRLHKDGHLLYCTPQNLKETIKSIQEKELLPFSSAKTEKFAQFMDSYFTFVS